MKADFGSAVCELNVPGYEIVHSIGSGGMGQVYLARQLPLGRLVALKVLAIDANDHTGERIARFRREAELMANLSHPNVLPVFQYGETEGRPYLILEYIAHGDLRRAMPEGQPMPADRVMAILNPVAEALSYLHSRGILHRDLKPENILMHEGTVPKVADFGVAVSLLGSGSLTKTGHRIGTIGYVAPEQHYQLDVDERADQFSLAALAYELLTGQRALGICKPPSHHNPALGPEVDAVILQGLQELPKNRFPSVLEFAAALGESLSEPTDVPPRKWDRSLVWPIVLAPVLLLVAWRMRPAPPHPPPGHWPPPDRNGGPIPAPVVQEIPVPQADLDAPPPPGPNEPKSEEFTALTAIYSQRIWIRQGKPANLTKDQNDANWYEAEKQVTKDVAARAYQIWQSQNSPKGPRGKALSKPNWLRAEKEILKAARAVENAQPK